MESEEDMETAFVGINDHTLDGQKVHLEMLRSSKPPTSPEKEKETKTSPPPKEETNQPESGAEDGPENEGATVKDNDLTKADAAARDDV